MTLDELAGLLAASRFLARGEPVEREGLRAVPELADGLPPVLFDARGAHVWSGCGEVVRAAASALPGQLLAAGRGEDLPDLAGDPLVGALERLLIEGARHSPGAAVVPVLEVLRVVHGLFGADPAFVAVRADPVALRRIGAAVQARLATACARAGTSTRVPALAFALARCRLLPLYARGTLDRDPAWAEVAAVLDVPYADDTAETVERAVRVAVRGIADRRAAGKGTADDAGILLRFLAPVRLEPGAESAAASLVLDPDGLAALLPALGRFVDAKALVAAGVDKTRAERLLTPAGGLAAASVLVELLTALRVWDVLSQLVAAVGPAPVRALGVPRSTPAKVAVVAVGAGRLRAEGGQREVAWDELVRTVENGVVVEGAGLAAFPDAVDALRFALAVRARLPAVPVGMAWGAVYGGSDGRVARVTGPAVDAALRWVAGAPAPRPEGAEAGLRSVGGWLAGQGLGVDAAGAEAIQESRVRRGLATAADGPPGGDARVPRSLDLHRVCEFDNGVLAYVRVPGLSGGFEILQMAVPDWLALLDRDGERTAPSAPPLPKPLAEPVAVMAPAMAEAEAEDGGGWEMAEQDELPEEAPVTLDLGENTGEGWATSPAEPGFDLDPDGEGAPPAEEPLAFSGYFLPGADAAAAAPAAPAAPARAAPTSFDMSVEDDEEDTAEDTQEWGVPPAAAASPAPGTAPSAPPATTVFADDVALDGPMTSADPFAGDLFIPPEELRDPATPGPADPFARAAAPAPADPFADLSPAAEPPSDDPFSGFAASPNTAPEPESDDPFAGFSVGETSHGADPFADAPRAAREADAPHPASARRSGERPASGALDFDFLLKGYACYFERREAVFGRPYGTRMVDRHVYPYAGDPDEAYLAFLGDKIREGFVPRADMMGDLPRGVTLMPLDAEKLQRAWSDLS